MADNSYNISIETEAGLEAIGKTLEELRDEIENVIYKAKENNKHSHYENIEQYRKNCVDYGT